MIAEYLSAFGVPMSAEDALAVSTRNSKIDTRWETEIQPNLRLTKTLREWFQLFLVEQTDVAVSKDAVMPRDYQMTTMSGYPLHRFKKLKGQWFYMGPVYSPGFPGS